MTRPLNIHTFLAVPLILLTALLQGIGFFQRVEMWVMGILPAHLRTQSQRVILISMEKENGEFSSLDVAIALRGLSHSHPDCVIVNGTIKPEQGSVALLPNILARLTDNTGITLIIPQSPSPEALFRNVPMIRYSPWKMECKWPIFPGQSGPGTGAAYLPKNDGAKENLPLLAKSSEGAIIGSLWWWGLPQSVKEHPPFLVGESLLLLGNHALTHLTARGDFSKTAYSGAYREIPLDDFLLQIEQKERGIISPAFDSLWKESTVILGSHDDAAKISTFANLLREVSSKRLPLWSQSLMAFGWMALFFLIRSQPSGGQYVQCRLLSLLITLAVMLTTLLLIHQGIVIPFLPGIVTALLLFWRRSDKR